MTATQPVAAPNNPDGGLSHGAQTAFWVWAVAFLAMAGLVLLDTIYGLLFR